MLVQFGADAAEEAADAAHACGQSARGFLSRLSVAECSDEVAQKQLCQVREAALGATAQVPGLPNMWSGLEDSAVAQKRSATICGHWGSCMRSLDTRQPRFMDTMDKAVFTPKSALT